MRRVVHTSSFTPRRSSSASMRRPITAGATPSALAAADRAAAGGDRDERIRSVSGGPWPTDYTIRAFRRHPRHFATLMRGVQWFGHGFAPWIASRAAPEAGAVRCLRHAVRRLQRGAGSPNSCFPAAARRSPCWLARQQIEYTRLVSMSGRYRPFWDRHPGRPPIRRQRGSALTLDVAAPRAADGASTATQRAFPENLEVLRALQARRRASILQQRRPEMLGVAVKSAASAYCSTTC